MYILLPDNGFGSGGVDEWFIKYKEAAYNLGIHIGVYDPNDYTITKRPVPHPNGSTKTLVKGFIMESENYDNLIQNAKEAGMHLGIDGISYKDASYISRWYPKLVGLTPATVYIPNHVLSTSKVLELVHPRFLRGPVILRDQLKTRTPHETSNPEFYLSDTSSETLISESLEAMEATNPIGGVAFREYEPLQKDSEGNTVEYRTFIVNGVPLKTYYRSEMAVTLPDLYRQYIKNTVMPRLNHLDNYVVDLVRNTLDSRLRVLEIGCIQTCDQTYWDHPETLLKSFFQI